MSQVHRFPLGLLSLLVSLDVAVRVLEKVAVMHGAGPGSFAFAGSLLVQPAWWLALGLGPLQLWIWMRVLARTELSVAYPLSSLGYPLTMVVAARLFGECLTPRVWIGAGFMTVGAALVGSTIGHRRNSQTMPRSESAGNEFPCSDNATCALPSTK